MEFSFWGLPLSSSSSFLEYSDYVSGLKFVFELLCRIMEIQKKKNWHLLHLELFSRGVCTEI